MGLRHVSRMNPKGETLGTCSLEGIRRSPAKPPEVDLEFEIWIGVLNLTSWGTKSQLHHWDSFLIHALIPLIRLNPRNPGI